MNDSETPKERIADLYHRVASAYGQIGPNIFGYGGQHLVERIAMTKGARVLEEVPISFQRLKQLDPMDR